jgi:hypothetical protein
MIGRANIQKYAAANFRPPVFNGIAVKLQKKVSHRFQV